MISPFIGVGLVFIVVVIIIFNSQDAN
jgi:hypothetical protein